MRKLIHLAVLALVLASACVAQTISINWGSAQQTIDGFGGAAVDTTLAAGMPSNLADFFFKDDGGNDIGLSILRLQIDPTTNECNTWFTTEHGYGYSDGCVSNSNPVASGTILKGELATALAAKARGVTQFMATQWSPSGIYKNNGAGSYSAGSALAGNSSNYTAIAAELAGFVSLMSSNGIPIMALSPQNEPDISQAYPSCTWTADQFDAFVPVLNAALPASTAIMIPENAIQAGDYGGFAATTMNDSAAGPNVKFLAQHGYGTNTIVAWNTFSNNPLHLWETEISSQSSTYDGSMSDALSWANTIHQYLTVPQVNAFIWWFLSDQQFQGSGTDNAALTDSSGNIPKRAYITGNWSKFVRPGWHRVAVTNSGPLLVTAFTNPTGTQSAVVVVNTSNNVVASQAFSVGTQLGSAVTPWVTSSTLSLASQSRVSISAGTLTYNIPANSVVTLTNVQFSSSHNRVVLF